MAFPLAGALNSGLNLYQQLAGEATLVSFVDTQGRTLIQFDAILGETYQRQAQPTSFPIEDGAVISDHIVRAPITLDMLGIVTDTPISGKDSLRKEAISTLASAILPPVGQIAAAGASSLYSSMQGSSSPSRAAYAQLCRMQSGDPSATPSVPPTVFSVITKLQSYPHMMIADLTVQRDSGGGPWLSFAIKLVEMLVVSPQTLDLGQLDNAALGAVQQSLGEQQGSAFNANAYNQGEVAGEARVSRTLG